MQAIVQQISAKLRDDIQLEDLALPVPPKLLEQISSIQNDPFPNVQDIVKLLEDYPVVKERVIKLANSARFKTRVDIGSVKAAVMRLGISRILSLVSGMCITQFLAMTRTHGLENYYNKMWQQSLDVAAIGYVLAQEKAGVDPEKALLAGMVHNIGVVPILLSLDDSVLLHKNPGVMQEVAEIIIPKHYPYAGRVLLQSWNMPEDIVTIATSHRNNNRPEHDDIDLCDVIQMSRELSVLANFTQNQNEPGFVKSEIFKKFWPDWETAILEMSELEPDVENTRATLAV